jgi:hypothetical protein
VSAEQFLARSFAALRDIIRARAAERADHPALIEGDARLGQLVDRVAVALRRDGVERGDAVAICARTSVNCAAASLGTRSSVWNARLALRPRFSAVSKTPPKIRPSPQRRPHGHGLGRQARAIRDFSSIPKGNLFQVACTRLPDEEMALGAHAGLPGRPRRRAIRQTATFTVAIQTSA